MSPRTVFTPLILVFVLLAAFSVQNWSVLADSATLRVGPADVNAPLGMIMLVFTAVISALLVVYILLLQTGVLLDTRRLTKEIREQRALADTAETSRLTELRSHIGGEFRRLEQQSTEVHRGFADLFGHVEQEMATRLAESTATLSAHLGEIEDKLDRALAMARGANGQPPNP